MSLIHPYANRGFTSSPNSDPSRAPAPRKNRHLPAPPVSRPCTHPHAPHTSRQSSSYLAQFLPTNPPSPRIPADPLELTAHTCYPRPREGPTPRPGNAATNRDQAPGIRWDVENRPPASDPAPLSYSATRCHFCVTEKRAGQYRFAAVPPTPSATIRTECRRNEQISRSLDSQTSYNTPFEVLGALGKPTQDVARISHLRRARSMVSFDNQPRRRQSY